MAAAVASFDLAPWAAIELRGEDRLEWLQGQATQDVRGLTPGKRGAFCLCEPTGQLLAVLDAWALDDRIVLTTARETAEAVLARIERMTILEDVAAHRCGWQGVSIPATSSEAAPLSGLELPSEIAGAFEFDGVTGWALRSERTANGGWDLWFGHQVPSALLRSVPDSSAQSYEAARIEAGVPRWGADMGPRTLPPELGPAFEARHVSYAKGCYTGQEVLMRMHTRGHTNRTWVGLVGREPIAMGSVVMLRDEAVGKVTSSAVSASLGPIGAASLRNVATVAGTRVTIDGEEAEVRPMPLVPFA